jgi:deazaflavin-dependent oxidoreductase (nitroreductase family)
MNALARAAIRLHAALYRLSGGKIGGRRGTVPILLLTTAGRRSGRRRTVPLQYLAEGGALVVVASNGGRDHHPGWLHNLRAQPRVEVRRGRETQTMRAEEVTSAEREQLWPRVVELWRGYDEYRARTRREIPLVILRPD